MTQYDFTHKSVLITGASRGVGRATALAFAKAGASVAVHFHQEVALATSLVEELAGEGHFHLQADAADSRAMANMVTQASEAFGGKLDILVNNAGIFLPHDLNSLAFEEWMAAFERTIAVNLVAAAATAYQAAHYMRPQGSGSIINVGSRGAFRGEEGQPGYGAAKAGLHALSQSLARALGGHGITVHALAPGFIETAMARPHLQGAAGDAVRAQSPLNRVATVAEIADAILFLASENARWTTGCVLDINGASYLH